MHLHSQLYNQAHFQQLQRFLPLKSVAWPRRTSRRIAPLPLGAVTARAVRARVVTLVASVSAIKGQQVPHCPQVDRIARKGIKAEVENITWNRPVPIQLEKFTEEFKCEARNNDNFESVMKKNGSYLSTLDWAIDQAMLISGTLKVDCVRAMWDP